MKIGIVTFYGVANYGAMLQAYALWKYLERRGHSVEFIDVIFCQSRRSSFFRCLISRSLKGVKIKLAHYLQHHITKFAKCYPQTRRFASLQDLKEHCPKYDVLIVGSDQMWNPKWLGVNDIPVVFLAFAPEGCRRVSYAASFGVTQWEGETSACIVGRLLREFQSISVREESGIKIVNELSGQKAECLIDPTLLWTDVFYRKLMSSGCAPSRPYVYNYILRTWTDETLENVCLKVVMRETGLQEALSDSCLPEGFFAPLFRGIGISDRVSVPVWLERIAHSDFVVTNSFHGTVFAILFRRPFVTVRIRGKMEGMNERILTLLGNLGLGERIVSDERGICRAMRSKIDWGSVFKRLDVLRDRTNDFFVRNAI